MDFDRLRNLLCQVAFWEHGAVDRLIAFLEENGHYRAEWVKKAPRDPHCILPIFGIHRCSGCGGDPEWFKGKYGRECRGCGGRCWMHECRATSGVVYEDPDYPGWGFTVCWMPGMFEPNPPDGWVAMWKE